MAMSVAMVVSDELSVRSADCARVSGRSTGVEAISSTGVATSTTSPSDGEVVIMRTEASRKLTADAITCPKESTVAPNWSLSEDATLSTSPVGTRRLSTCPRWTACRDTRRWIP